MNSSNVIEETDIRGNRIYCKYPSDGNEAWYDDKGRLILAKYSDGLKIWVEYNSNGEKIREKYSSGYELRWSDEGKMIYHKDEHNNEWNYTYDENGKLSYTTDQNGNKKYYDENDSYYRNNTILTQLNMKLSMKMKLQRIKKLTTNHSKTNTP